MMFVHAPEPSVLDVWVSKVGQASPGAIVVGFLKVVEKAFVAARVNDALERVLKTHGSANGGVGMLGVGGAAVWGQGGA